MELPSDDETFLRVPKRHRKTRAEKEAAKRVESARQHLCYESESPDGKIFEWHLNLEKTRNVTQMDLDAGQWLVRPTQAIMVSDVSVRMIPANERTKIYANADAYIGVIELPAVGGRPEGVLFFVCLVSDGRKEARRRIQADLQRPLFAHVGYDFDLWGETDMAWRNLRGEHIPALDAFAWVRRRKLFKQRAARLMPPPPESSSDSDSSSEKPVPRTQSLSERALLDALVRYAKRAFDAEEELTALKAQKK